MTLRASGMAVAGCISLLGSVGAFGEVVKRVEIESTPSGAEVFLLEGTKKTSLGITPTRPQLEFHSEMSVLRLTLAKSGFQAQTVEVSAQQSKLMVSLRPQRLASLPEEIRNEKLREVQARIFRRVEESVGRSVSSMPALEWEMAGLIRVVDLDASIYLLAPITLSGASPQESLPGASEVWQKVARPLVEPLAEIARTEPAIKGVVVSAGLDQLRRDFAVGSQVVSSLEMQCVPGTQIVQQYDICARRVPVLEQQRDGSWRNTGLTRCEGGTVTRSVHNPCLTKTPVTKAVVAVTPQAMTRSAQAQVQFVVPIGLLGSRHDLFSQLGVLRTDAQGKVVEKRGPVPAPLPNIP
jgi:hypothetical protein